MPEAQLPEKNENQSVEKQLEIVEKNIDSLKQAFNECSRAAQWLAEQNEQQLREANEAIVLLNRSLERMTQITVRYNNDCDAVIERIKKMAEVIRILYPIDNTFLFLILKRHQRLAQLSAAAENHRVGGKFIQISQPVEKAFYYLKLLEKVNNTFQEYKDIAAAQLMLDELDALLLKDSGDENSNERCIVS